MPCANNIACEIQHKQESLSILIVDDDPGILSALSSLLHGISHAVAVTSDAFDAYTILLRSKVDLLIVDMRMPQINGLELIKKVKEIKPALKAILMTAYDSPQIKKEAIAIEGVQYIEKPFTQERLNELLREVKVQKQEIRSHSQT